MLRNLATSADNTHNPTSAPPQYDDDFEDDEEQNETQNETQNEEDEYYDDDFEEDEATPVAGRAVEGETEIMRAIREENERALRASDGRYRHGDENDRPIGGFDDGAFDFDSHARDRVPERKVKSFPGKGARRATTLTDAQIRARSRAGAAMGHGRPRAPRPHDRRRRIVRHRRHRRPRA